MNLLQECHTNCHNLCLKRRKAESWTEGLVHCARVSESLEFGRHSQGLFCKRLSWCGWPLGYQGSFHLCPNPQLSFSFLLSGMPSCQNPSLPFIFLPTTWRQLLESRKRTRLKLEIVLSRETTCFGGKRSLRAQRSYG